MKSRVMPGYAVGLTALWLFIVPIGCRSLRQPADTGPPSLDNDSRILAQALAHYAQGLVSEYEHGRDSDEALDHFARAAELDPENERLSSRLASTYLVRKQPNQAIEVLEPSCRRSPDNLTTALGLAMAYHYAGKFEMAINQYRRALKIDPSNTDIFETIINLLFYRENDAQALDVLDQAFRCAARPERMRAFCYRLGVEFVELGQTARALPCFQLAAKHATSRRSELYHLLG